MTEEERYVFIRKNSINAFPREVATPRRQVVSNWGEFKKFFEDYCNRVDLYTNVYGYDELLENGYKPQYESANIDKLYFDLDPEGEPDKCWENVKKLHRFAKERDLEHNIVFSGGGFHVYIYTTTDTLMSKRGAMREASYWFVEEANLDEEFIDTSVFGDPAQITRVPNSYNFKKHRQRYCIPLGKRHMEMSYDEIAECAEDQNFDYHTWGSKKLDLVYFDEQVQKNGNSRGSTQSFHREDLEEIELEDAEGMSLEHVTLPRCLQRIVQKGRNGDHVGFRERFLLITWLRDMAVDIEDAKEFLKENLQGTKETRPNETDYEHMINEVTYLKYGQLSDIYNNERRKDRNFPKHENLIKEGVCKEEWGECQRLYKIRKTVNGEDPRQLFKEMQDEKSN